MDNLAHRYGCLPSYVLSNATTFDLYVLDVGAKWRIYQHELMENGNTHVPQVKHTQEELQAMIDNVRNANVNN